MITAQGPIPPLGGNALPLFLLQIALLLLVATVLGRLAVRLSMPPIVGELLTGVVLGPSLLGPALPALHGALFPEDPAQVHLLDAFGQFGVVLLVGVTGLQIDAAFARRRAATVARVSLPCFFVPLVCGLAAGYFVPGDLLAEGAGRTVFAVFLGIAMCMTGITVLAKTLMDMGLMHRDVGQLIVVSGAVDDVLAWIALSAVATMVATGLQTALLVKTVALVVVFVVAAAVIGRPLVRGVMTGTVARADPGVTLGATVVIMFLFSVAAHMMGMEAVFGALIAGILIRGTGMSVLTRLAPLRTFVVSVLAPVFFAAAGLRMDLTALADPGVLVTALVLLLVAVVSKFAGAFVGAWASGLSRWEAVALGGGMNARGVVEVVLALVGLRLGVLSTEMYTVIVLIAVATSLMCPPVLRRAAARIAVTAEEELRQVESEAAWNGTQLSPAAEKA